MVTVSEGGLQKAWVKDQTTYNTIEAFVAADAVSPLKGTLKIEPEYPHEKSKEAVGTHSLQDELSQSKGGKWSGQFHVKPNAVGTAPDIGEIIRAAMGVETVNAGTSVVYSLSDTARVPLQILQQIEDRLQQVASGCDVEELTIEAQKGSAPTISASGAFATFAAASADEVGVGGIAYNATTLPLDNDSRGCALVGARIQFVTPADDGGTAGSVTGSTDETFDLADEQTLSISVDGGTAQSFAFADTDFAAPGAATAAEVVAAINARTTGLTAVVSGTTKVQLISDTVGASSSIQVAAASTADSILGIDNDAHSGTVGTGYAVTAVDDTDDSADITISPAVVSRAGHAAGTVIEPWAPSQTVSGTKLVSGMAKFEIDSVEFGFVSAKISIATGLHLRDKEAQSETPTGIIGGERAISVEIQCYHLTGNPSNAAIHGRAWEQATHEIDLRIGPDTAAQRMKINIPSIRFEVTPLDLPEAEEAMVTLKGLARQSAAACDEMTITFD